MITLKNGVVYLNKEFKKIDVLINNKKIIKIGDNINEGLIIDCSNKLISPSFIDPHVHLREPGYEYKETIKMGCNAAVKGGYTTLFLMPNLNPVVSNIDILNNVNDIIKKDSLIQMIQLCSITKEGRGLDNLVNFDSLANYTIGFSDDGNGIIYSKTMYEAMLNCQRLDKFIISHCEDKSLLYDGYIREGNYSKNNNHKGILDIVETLELGRNLILANKTKVKFHMCHISVKDSVNLIRYYKSIGCDVSCEVTPHHLLLTEDNLKEDGNYKMNPPLGSNLDRLELIKGLKDNTIDFIATDHAPHSMEEKNKGLKDSLFGIVGLETSFPLLYTNLVLKNIISLDKLIDLMSLNISKRFKLESHEIKENNYANICIIDLNDEYLIDNNNFYSKGKNTPFNNWKVKGRIIKTIYKGDVVYDYGHGKK